MSVKDRIRDKLQGALAPVALEVVDESHKHAGHMLHPGGVEPRGETHFAVKVVSAAFAGKTEADAMAPAAILSVAERTDYEECLSCQ